MNQYFFDCVLQGGQNYSFRTSKGERESLEINYKGLQRVDTKAIATATSATSTILNCPSAYTALGGGTTQRSTVALRSN